MLMADDPSSELNDAEGVCIASEKTCNVCLDNPDKCTAIAPFKDTKDMDRETFRRSVIQAADAIESRLATGAKVLVNCFAGINRSGASCCMFAVKHRGWRPDDAIAYIRFRNKDVRSLPALTNTTFVQFLREMHNPTLTGGGCGCDGSSVLEPAQAARLARYMKSDVRTREAASSVRRLQHRRKVNDFMMRHSKK